jgi:prepilin-type N-terminal cleavage/methylation domain-containing protein
MRTSAARTFREPTSRAPLARLARRAPAFTLLEMLIVLVIVGLIAAVSVPLFQTLIEGQVQREATRLARLIRVLRNEAVLTQTEYRLMMSLKERSYWVESRSNGKFAARQDSSLLSRHPFPTDMVLTDLVVLGDTHKANVEEKPVPIIVDPTGFVDSFLLHFVVSNTEYTLKVSGFRAEVDLVKGYVRDQP